MQNPRKTRAIFANYIRFVQQLGERCVLVQGILSSPIHRGDPLWINGVAVIRPYTGTGESSQIALILTLESPLEASSDYEMRIEQDGRSMYWRMAGAHGYATHQVEEGLRHLGALPPALQRQIGAALTQHRDLHPATTQHACYRQVQTWLEPSSILAFPG